MVVLVGVGLGLASVGPSDDEEPAVGPTPGPGLPHRCDSRRREGVGQVDCPPCPRHSVSAASGLDLEPLGRDREGQSSSGMVSRWPKPGEAEQLAVWRKYLGRPAGSVASSSDARQGGLDQTGAAGADA